MNDIINQEQSTEPEFDPDLAYDLSSHRATEDGVIDGDSLSAEIKRDLQAITPIILENDQQIRTLYIQINGASSKEEEGIASHIISECQKADPRIHDIKVNCEAFQGDFQVMESNIATALGEIGFQANKTSTGLTQFELKTFHQPIRFQIHKEEQEELTADEIQQIADYIEPQIFSAVDSWTPGSKLTLHLFSHNTHPMHQDMVETIFNQVFNFALQNLTTKYSVENPPLIPNINMNLKFVGEMFSNESNRITYKSSKNTDETKKNDADSE